MSEKEFEFIAKVEKLLPRLSGDVVVGCGDDAAVVREREGKFGIYTVDALVEDVHYLRSWKKVVENFYYLLGRKLLSISLSDVAAMGGAPRLALLTVGVPEISPEIYSLYEGLLEVAKNYGVSVVGGDTVRSSSEFFSLFLVGESKGYMLRSNARVGDIIAVTGNFGDSRAGLEVLIGKLPWNDDLVGRFLNPLPRLEEGKEALNLGITCCTDVSDGLAFNLYTIAVASDVAIDIDREKIPISSSLLSVLGSREKALDYALFGGEDYELIISFPERLLDKVERLGFKPIGRVVEDSPAVYLGGELLPSKGYDHFGVE